MAKCGFCGAGILFGGVQQQGLRFCNKDHAQKGGLVIAGRQIPDQVVAEQVRRVHQGNCPRCKGAGPVDVYNSYRVWSALLLTRWWTNSQLCCRRCGRRANLRDALASLVLGWWGFPWGLLITPLQLVRNIGAAASGRPQGPSPALANRVRLQLASHALAQQPAAAPRVPELKWE